MDEGWTRWVLEQYGFEFVTAPSRGFPAPLGDKVDVIILADDARIPVEGAGGRRAGATGRPAGAGGDGPRRALRRDEPRRQEAAGGRASSGPSTRTA